MSTHTTRSATKRWLVSTTAAVGATLALGPLAAAATPPIFGDISDLDPASAVTACQTASLSVTLTGQNPYNDVPAGQKAPGGVKGYTVTIRQVKDIDLGTAEGWDAIQNLTAEDAAKRTLGEPMVATTDANGMATVNDVPVGLYFMTVTPPNDDAHTYLTYKPQLVTVPVGMPGSEGVKAGWNCHPVIQPKSEDTTPTESDKPTEPTEPDKPTEPTKPGEPTEPGQPGQPGGSMPDGQQPGGSSEGSSSSNSGSLANTGVSVLGVLLVGAGLIGLGLVLKRRRHPED